MARTHIHFTTHHGDHREEVTVWNVELTPRAVDEAYRKTGYGANGWLTKGNWLEEPRRSSMDQKIGYLLAGERVEFGWTDAHPFTGNTPPRRAAWAD